MLATRWRELLLSESTRRLSPHGLDWLFAFLPDTLLALSVALFVVVLFRVLARSPRQARGTFILCALLIGALALLETLGHLFLMTTGSLLDSTVFHLASRNNQEFAPIVLSELTLQRGATLAITVLAPLALIAIAWTRLSPLRLTGRSSTLTTGLLLLSGTAALGLSFAPLGPRPFAWNQHAASLLVPRDALGGSFFDKTKVDFSGVHEPANIRLQRIDDPGDPSQPAHQRAPNLALIILESTGSRATSLDESGPATTPFLASLAKESIVTTRMRTVIPHTTKALISILCGIEPILAAGIQSPTLTRGPTKFHFRLIRGCGRWPTLFELIA